jgi:predicted ATPase
MPIIANLLSIPTGERYPALDLTPKKYKEKCLRALLAQIAGRAAGRPILICYEDLHWSDPTTLELLDLLVDRAATLRLLVILTFRPEFAPAWVGRPTVTLLSLSRLPPRRRAEMILQVAGGKPLPKEIADQIADRTDGVPLFIEELTKSVVEGGLLEAEGDRYVQTGPIPALAIPASLQASLLARFDRLPSTREVIQIAAALGRDFSHELISAVAAMPEPQLNQALAQLVQAELIYRRGLPPDAEYSFKHALVQDAAYNTLLRGQRQQLHARIAGTLDLQFPEIVASHPALLARHYSEAGLGENAVRHWLRAGQQALTRSAMTEGEVYLQKGLNILAGLPNSPLRQRQELELQMALVPALALTKGYSAAELGVTLQRARTLAEQFGRPEWFVTLSIGQWAFHVLRAEISQALPLAEHIEKIGEVRRDIVVQWIGLRMSGTTRVYQGKFTLARMLLERCYALRGPAHSLALPMGIMDNDAACIANLAQALTYLGYLDQGRARLDEALSGVGQLGKVAVLAYVLHCAILTDALTSSSKLHSHAEQLFVLSNEYGFPLHRSSAMVALGSVPDQHLDSMEKS